MNKLPISQESERRVNRFSISMTYLITVKAAFNTHLLNLQLTLTPRLTAPNNHNNEEI